MPTVTSKDGTKIAYDRQGSGPAVILVDGALCYRSFGPMPGLAHLLAPHFTVYTYDRRGRGDSGNSAGTDIIASEVEDIKALIDQAGGSAYLYGISSGGALALEAALRLGDKVKKLAIYEAPYNSSESDRSAWKEYRQKLAEHLAAGRSGDAAALFMGFVGTPNEQIEGMRQAPVWPMFEAVAPTLANDAEDLGPSDRAVPTQRAARLNIPVLVVNGGASFPFMDETARALARAIPHAKHRVLDGQRHDVEAEVIAPVLVDFFHT